VLERAAGRDESRSGACRSTNISTLDALGEISDVREVLQAVNHLFVAVLLESGAVVRAEIFEVDRDAVGRTMDGAHCQERLGANLSSTIPFMTFRTKRLKDAEALHTFGCEAKGALTIFVLDAVLNGAALTSGEVAVDEVAIASRIGFANRIGRYEQK